MLWKHPQLKSVVGGTWRVCGPTWLHHLHGPRPGSAVALFLLSVYVRLLHRMGGACRYTHNQKFSVDNWDLLDKQFFFISICTEHEERLSDLLRSFVVLNNTIWCHLNELLMHYLSSFPNWGRLIMKTWLTNVLTQASLWYLSRLISGQVGCN